MEQKKRGRGRPPLDPADRRDAMVYVRVTGAEEEAISAAAEAAGESVSDWGRRVLVKAARRAK